MDHNKICVGTILFRRYGKEIKEHVVQGIGKKYFTVDDMNRNERFGIDTLRYEHKDYSQFNIQLYRSKEEIILEDEVGSLRECIRSFFSSFRWDLSIEQMRSIKEIIQNNDLKK